MATSGLYATVAGAGGKTGADWANAYDQTQINAALSALNNQILYLEADTYTPGALLYDTSSGTTTNPTGIVAVNKSTHLEDGSQAVFDAESASVILLTIYADYYHLRNLSFINSTTYPVQANSSTYKALYGNFYNVNISNCTNGFYARYAYYCYFEKCTFSNMTTDAVEIPYGCVFKGCKFIGNSGTAIDSAGYNTITGSNIFHDNGTGIELSTTDCVYQNIIDGNTTGVKVDAGSSISISHNKITNNTTGIDVDAILTSADWNYFYNNNTDIDWGTISSEYKIDNNVSMSSDYYNDRASDDFNSTDSDESKGIAFPLDATNIPYLSPFPPEYTVITTITDIAPASGVETTTITITGTNFGSSQGSGTVKVNAVSLTSISWADTEISGDAPANSDGTYDIVVTTDAGGSVTAPNAFTYASSSAPTGGAITKLEPQGNGRFKVTIGAVTGTTQGTYIYVKSSASVFSGGAIAATIPQGWTTFEFNLSAEGTPIADGVVWYVGTRPFNSTDIGTNTDELSTRTYGASKVIQVKQSVGL